MRRCIKRSLTFACLLALAHTPWLAAQSSTTFSIGRIVACTGVDKGQPVGAAAQFPANVGRIFIWFESTPAPRDIALRTEWYINDAHVDDASYDLTITRGISNGYVSLALPPGTPFPEGNYRVELTASGLVLASHRFVVRGSGAGPPAASSTPSARDSSAERTTPGPASGAVRTPGARVLQRPALGFSLSIPAGWAEKPDQDAAARIVEESQPEIGAMIFVQKEAAPSAVTDVLAKASVKLKNDTERTFISSKFDVVLDRPALIVVLEDKTARYKLTLLPRDEEDTSQIYYGIMTMAPLAAFAQTEPTLDRIAAGFQILPMAEDSARAAAAPPVAAAVGTETPRPGPSADGFDRAKVIERILAPQPARKPDAAPPK